MDTSRNDLLGEIAADAALERTDFLASSAAQLGRFLDANESRIRELGGLVLIDDEVDYLAIAEDMTFRSRTRYLDEATGQWTTETEVIETVAELVELYNLADVFASFAEASGLPAGETAAEESEQAETVAARTGSLYAEAADDWAGRGYAEAPQSDDEAAERMYDLALVFQEKSQQTEAQLLEQFEAAVTELSAALGDFIVVDDDDERLTLKASGTFAAEVLPEEEASSGEWRKLDSPDEIVEFYDPTDVFGDLADALAEAFPEVAAEEGTEGEEAEGEEAGDDEEAEDDGEAEGEGEEAGEAGAEAAGDAASDAEEDVDRK
jgi:hypothetical protein